MKSQAFLHYTDVPLTLIGLLLFLTVFCGVVCWTGLKVNQQKYRSIERQPLNDGEIS